MDPRCGKTVDELITLQNHEFFLNPQLSKTCSGDAVALCPSEVRLAANKRFSSGGALIGCLIKNRLNVTSANCKMDLLAKQRQRLENIKNNPAAFEACADDAWKWCEAESFDGTSGRVRQCLWNHRDHLSSHCAGLTDAAMAMESEDFRLNLEMQKSCKIASKRYCKGETPERVIGCLLDNMHGSDMDTRCRKQLVKETTKRAHGIIFNPSLHRACKAEVQRLQLETRCSNTPLINCLAQHKEDVVAARCKAEIFKVQKLQSADVRARPLMLKACTNDAAKLCTGVLPGNGKLHACLRKHIKELASKECQEHVLQVKLAESMDAMLNPMIRSSCSNERKVFCNSIEHGDQRLLICLKREQTKDGFGEPCKKALLEVDIPEKLVKAQRDHDDVRVQNAVKKALSQIKAYVSKQTPHVSDLSATTIAGVAIAGMVCCSMSLIVVLVVCRRCRGKYQEIDGPEAGDEVVP
jgi:Golgi apparatus protein 1